MRIFLRMDGRTSFCSSHQSGMFLALVHSCHHSHTPPLFSFLTHSTPYSSIRPILDQLSLLSTLAYWTIANVYVLSIQQYLVFCLFLAYNFTSLPSSLFNPEPGEKSSVGIQVRSYRCRRSGAHIATCTSFHRRGPRGAQKKKRVNQ